MKTTTRLVRRPTPKRERDNTGAAAHFPAGLGSPEIGHCQSSCCLSCTNPGGGGCSFFFRGGGVKIALQWKGCLLLVRWLFPKWGGSEKSSFPTSCSQQHPSCSIGGGGNCTQLTCRELAAAVGLELGSPPGQRGLPLQGAWEGSSPGGRTGVKGGVSQAEPQCYPGFAASQAGRLGSNPPAPSCSPAGLPSRLLMALPTHIIFLPWGGPDSCVTETATLGPIVGSLCLVLRPTGGTCSGGG